MGEDMELEHSCWDGEEEVLASNEGSEEARAQIWSTSTLIEHDLRHFVLRNLHHAVSLLLVTTRTRYTA